MLSEHLAPGFSGAAPESAPKKKTDKLAQFQIIFHAAQTAAAGVQAEESGKEKLRCIKFSRLSVWGTVPVCHASALLQSGAIICQRCEAGISMMNLLHKATQPSLSASNLPHYYPGSTTAATASGGLRQQY
jgi:hypothetical protein